ncbi:indolepyruvate oxidoreductase subunit beta family protein [Mesorhizobium xinjiangense]|uniref:indolepyruvate oxidoreductase subunit beta family protein n=1 Tax=Mesorhizobium xinjiangense TaxID=2678685 RepID=UPI0012EDACE7|nr:indolepyruvate oxidoreductase subunit beta family protein [Mesorhizobium xinjiangense]
MNVHRLPDLPAGGDDATASIIKIAILAVGGQGGGVLSDWIISLAESNGYRAQSTSVAGVAQRTGATIYYVEMAPDTGGEPVFSLSPSPGDVDILIAAELMEAGRAIMRGFSTPDRTTLIASAHRVLAVSEKIAPGDGRADAQSVMTAASAAAHQLVCFDMEKIAVEAGSVISSSLFGALAGSGALPFSRAAFEETIRRSGRGVDASLRAFAASCERAGSAGEDSVEKRPDPAAPSAEAVAGPRRLVEAWQRLCDRVDALPGSVREMAMPGLKKVVDYQDVAYGAAYLDHVSRALAGDTAENGYAFSVQAAKYAANAMVYDDIIRVADLKTRTSRERRLRKEQGVARDGIVQVTEYFHPRMEEVCGTLPAGLGRWIEARPKLFAWCDRRINKGRRIRTDSLSGYLMLWVVASLRPWRRRLLRHTVETAHLENWFETALQQRERYYALGVEVLKCRRLIKGYSDTHARGQSKFARVMAGLPLIEHREDGADWLRRLREAALLDEDGDALDGALKTVATL